MAIAQREHEINDIAKGIIELSDIFKDLQGMVIDQGTMLDRIDYNVEKMAVDVKEAEKELTTVSYSKTSYVLLVRPVSDLWTGYKLSETVHETKNTAPITPPCHWNVRDSSYQTKEVQQSHACASAGRRTYLSQLLAALK